jgi:hypothetical protein
MGDTLRGGTREDLSGSLALYIEQAFDSVRAEYGLGPLPTENRDDRMIMFLGIARGIVNYLDDFTEAFTIDHHRTGTDTHAFRHSDTRPGHVRIQVGP